MLVGYADLGKINNLLLDYEQQYNDSGRISCPLAKCMLVFMVRGLFTSLKFPYVQFPAASTKEADIFSTSKASHKALTKLELCVVSVICDGASDNRRMISMHNPDSKLSYKTVNVYSDEWKK